MIEKSIREIQGHFPEKHGAEVESMILAGIRGYKQNIASFLAALKGNLLLRKSELRKQQKPLELEHLEDALKKASESATRK